MDDFLIKYTDEKDVQHLLDTLRQVNTISTDWTASLYCGVTLDWDYETRTCDLSIPGYIEEALKIFIHPIPTQPQHAPYLWAKLSYGAKIQYVGEEDTSPSLFQYKVTHIQKVIGKFYYYTRAVGCTIITALGELASSQTLNIATKKVAENVVWFLNYAETYPNAKIRYHASGMVLHIDSDSSYLSVSKARSRVGVIFI